MGCQWDQKCFGSRNALFGRRNKEIAHPEGQNRTSGFVCWGETTWKSSQQLLHAIRKVLLDATLMVDIDISH